MKKHHLITFHEGFQHRLVVVVEPGFTPLNKPFKAEGLQNLKIPIGGSWNFERISWTGGIEAGMMKHPTDLWEWYMFYRFWGFPEKSGVGYPKIIHLYIRYSIIFTIHFGVALF